MLVVSIIISVLTYLLIGYCMQWKVLDAWNANGDDLFDNSEVLIFAAGFAPFPIINIFIFIWMVRVVYRYKTGNW